MRKHRLQVVLFHNAVSPDDSAADRDVLVQAEAIWRALESLGHSWQMLPCTLDLESARQGLEAARPDVVFQLVESLAGSDQLAYLATGLLDVLRIPYTGSPTEALFLTNHKLLAKERLEGAGLPTPPWIAAQGRAGRGSAFVPGATYVLKAVGEHASYGLDEHSLVQAATEMDLRDRLAEQSRRLARPCFAEQYIDGREFNLSVLASPEGPHVLPLAEIDFSAFPEGKPRIVGSRAKWLEGSFEFENTPRRFDFAAADGPLLERLAELARRTWRLFGLGGYVRVDFRVDALGQPWILEINANPCLSPDAGFAAALRQAAIPFEQAIQRILDDARRGP